MTNRRAFLAGILAWGLAPRVSWADAGSPAFLSAARHPDGSFALCGLSDRGAIVFDIPLPGRGHAAAAHPKRPEAIAFARRPGTYALVIDCVTGRETARLTCPKGRHFYGHGVFSANGAYLYTTENDYDAARGVVGVWDVAQGYRRIAEFWSGGVGPHDIRLMPDGARLAVANGGIETHPDTGRTKLNLPMMRPNLAFLDLQGGLLDRVQLDHSRHRNSIRHLAVGGDGQVVFAMQWQGDISDRMPVAACVDPTGKAEEIVQAMGQGQRQGQGQDTIAAMRGYAGSVAVNTLSDQIAVTSPRGGVLQMCSRVSSDGGHAIRNRRVADVCGVASFGTGFIVTTGEGVIALHNQAGEVWRIRHPVQWDNHLVALPAI